MEGGKAERRKARTEGQLASTCLSGKIEMQSIDGFHADLSGFLQLIYS